MDYTIKPRETDSVYRQVGDMVRIINPTYPESHDMVYLILAPDIIKMDADQSALAQIKRGMNFRGMTCNAGYVSRQVLDNVHMVRVKQVGQLILEDE